MSRPRKNQYWVAVAGDSKPKGLYAWTIAEARELAEERFPGSVLEVTHKRGPSLRNSYAEETYRGRAGR